MASYTGLAAHSSIHIYLAFLMMVLLFTQQIVRRVSPLKPQSAATIFKSVYGSFLEFPLLASRQNVREEEPLSRTLKVSSIFILILLSLVSAVPRRRYDQWNYHLSVPKWIVDLGGLPQTIFNDHIYFTGSYEYFSGIFRIFSSHDVFVQSATSALTFLLVGACSAVSLMTFVGSRYPLKEPKDKPFLFLGFFLLTVLAPWDRECLYSAKPDYLLIPMTLAAIGMASWILRSLPFSDGGDSTESHPGLRSEISFTFGVLITGGIAIKITWIHFIAALFFGSLFFMILNRSKLRLDKLKFVMGLFLGILLALPVLIKNFVFFGDPLYPASIPGLVSEYRLDFVDAYWRDNSSPVRNAEQLVQFLKALPQVLIGSYGFLLAALFLSTVTIFREFKTASFWQRARIYLNRPSIFVLMIYMAFWPLLHRAEIYSRFLIPIAALLVWEIATRAQSLKRLYLVLFFLFFAQADPHILLRQAFQSFSGIDSYYAKTAENEVLHITRDLAAERLKLAKEAGRAQPNQKFNVLSNSAVSYFYSDPVWFVCGYALRVELQKKGVSWTAQEAFDPFPEEMIFEMLNQGDFDYYAHFMDSDYCPRPEMLQFMKKYGTRVGTSEFLFKIEKKS